MAAQPFTVDLSRKGIGPLFVALSSLNLLFTATTGLFIYLWARLDSLGDGLRGFTRHWLIQGHLGTENVVAVWYSSMLLLLVALASATAFAVGNRYPGVLRHGWLLLAGIFALLSLDEIGSFHERVGMMPLGAENKPAGWIYVLAVPISAVAAFMLAFAWKHLRTTPKAYAFITAGIGMFLLNPVLERVEMAMIHGAGATPGTWQRMVHDVLQVLEEGGLELFGILCFLAAVMACLRAAAGESLQWKSEQHVALVVSRALTGLLAAGTLAAAWLVVRLPEGDTGNPENWFPAAAWLGVALVVVTMDGTGRWTRIAVAGSATLVSAWFGSGLYVYTEWLYSSTRWHLPVAGVCAAGLALELVFRWSGLYLLRRSPRSSTASPTLRRPRPNPS